MEIASMKARRLLGVALSGLVADEVERQLALFPEPVSGEREKDRTVSRTVDELEERFGRGAVKPGRMIDQRSREGRTDGLDR